MAKKVISFKEYLEEMKHELYAPYSRERKIKNLRDDISQIRRLFTYNSLSEAEKAVLKGTVSAVLSETEMFELAQLLDDARASLVAYA